MSLNSDNLVGKVCVVAGAAKSIGLGIAVRYAKYGININSICPGITDATGVWSTVSAGYIESMGMERDEIIEKFTAKIPLGRLTDIADVVDFVFFLTVSGDYCTGQAYNITGGREMH